MVRLAFIRQRLVLASIFTFSFFYFVIKTGLLTSLVRIESERESLESLKLRAPKSIKWQTEEPDAHTQLPSFQCKNTKQGKQFMTDELGYICERSDLLSTGCCPKNSSRFSCESCQTNIHCCAVYEYCVSCCLGPERKLILENVIKETTGSRLRAMLSVDNQFELCQMKCRTSSNSIHQETKYKNPSMKYCYGHEPKLPFESR